MRNKVLSAAFVLIALLGLAGAAGAQTPVNIVYPINGATYPITDPPDRPAQLGTTSPRASASPATATTRSSGASTATRPSAARPSTTRRASSSSTSSPAATHTVLGASADCGESAGEVRRSGRSYSATSCLYRRVESRQRPQSQGRAARRPCHAPRGCDYVATGPSGEPCSITAVRHAEAALLARGRLPPRPADGA